jgi:O-antigen ligase
MQNPIIGSGPRSFENISLSSVIVRKVGFYSHSNVIEILVSSGLIGFCLYYAMYAELIRRGLRLILSRSASINVYALVTAINLLIITMVYELFSVTYYVKEVWIVLSMILALLKIAEHGNHKATEYAV